MLERYAYPFNKREIANCDIKDELLLQSVNKASAEVNFRKKKIESRKWKLVADYLKESKPTANYSKNACKMRFEALENGTATIPPELDDDPEKRAAETAARLQEKQDKARAEEERKEDLANEAAMQEANAVNTCSARSRATGQIEVVRSPTVSPPHVNPDDAMFEAQGFSTQNSALTFVHPAAAASVTNIAKTVKSTSLGKDPLQPKKHTKAKLPKQDASSKTKAIQGASTTINSAPSSSKAVKIHKASKAPKVKFPASGRKANPTTNSGESVVTPKKPKVTAAKEPEATSTSVTEPPGDPPGPSFVKDTPQVSVEPLKGTKTAEATKATQGDLPKQTSTPPALSSSKRLALTLAKSFRADWTYKQRKAELRTRKLVQYGSKQDLSDRLDAADEANAARSVTTSSPGGLPDTIKTATTNISTVTPNAKAGPSKAIPKSTVSVSTSTISKGVAKSSTPGDLPKTTASNEPAKVKKPHKTASTQVAGPSATKPTVSVAMGTGSPRSTASSTDAVVKDSKPVDHKRSSGTTHTAPGPSRITQPTSSISSNPITGGRRLEISHLPRDINEDILRNFFREYPMYYTLHSPPNT